MPMRVIAFVTQKGGSGKTTLAVNLAVAAEQAGARVLILDLDPQASAEAWYQDREAETPRLARADAGELARALELARRQGFGHVLVDTPGRDEPAVAAAIRAADFCVVPCRPTPADMKATPATAATIRRLEKPAAFVLSQTPPRGFRIREAEVGLGVLGPVAPIGVVARNAFQDAHGRGLGITEYEPEGKAAQEIRELWAWLARKVEKLVP
ncbi:MAG TPA: ParA family protein [Geminicoccaceae bacterium]|nr:ParA family protein [Geminicoccus sp.]HMU52842.1 ParA family protein [Geminicoccaceae bacterium]